MNKILSRLFLGTLLFGGLFSFAFAQNATNYDYLSNTWGNPVLNADGSVSAAMPNGWGSYGADPFDVWTGINSDTGQRWFINNRWLSDFGGRKTAQLLGLNVTVYNNPGTCPNQDIAAGRVTNVICGSNSGRETPPGQWRYWTNKPDGTSSYVALEAYAPYFLMGKDDIAKYLFQNVWNPKLDCYLSRSPVLFSNSDTLDQLRQRVEGASCGSTSSGGSTGGSGTTSGGSTGTTGGTTSSAGSASVPVLARDLIDTLFNRFDQAITSVSSVGLNTGTTNTNSSTSNTSSGSSACYVFNVNLGAGSTEADVGRLADRLIKEGLLSVSKSVYDQQMVAAVSAYQEKYASQILTPLGLTSGTGYFGPSTRQHMNSNCSTGTTSSTGSTGGTGTGSTSSGTGLIINQPASTPIVYPKPLSSTIPTYSTSCSAWTSPTGVTQQNSEFYRGSLLRSESQGEFYRGFWYDKAEVTYVNNVATAPTPIYFGNIGFNPFETKEGIATEDNLLLKKGDKWIITDQKISPAGHQKVLSLLGVSSTAQSGEASDLQKIRTYSQSSFYGNSYTWGYSQYFMRCEDELAKFLFVNRNNADVQKYFGYAYKPTSYNSPESFMQSVNLLKSADSSKTSNTTTIQVTGGNGVTTQTTTTTLSADQIKQIETQITALLSQVAELQAKLNQL